MGSAVIVLITFFITILVFTRLVQTASLKQAGELLGNNINRINEITVISFENSNTYTDVIYRKTIDNIAYNLDASIIVFDTEGKIKTVSGISENKYVGQYIDKKIVRTILSGKTINEIGILNNIHHGKSTLTVGAPIIGNGFLYGGVLVNRPVPDILDSYNSVVLKLIVVVILAVLFLLVLFYTISKKITTPVSEINSVVNEFAKGNFDKRVEYESDDELGELSSNINRMANSLENLEKMRSTFVSDVSHELRTPMTTISGFVEGILDGTIEENEKDKYLELVLSESKRLSRLVNDLLNLTRVQNKETALQMSEFDIVDVTFQTLLKFEKQIEDGDFEIETNISDEKMMVYADKDAIIQVITNLLGNACKFTPDKGKITISVTKNNTHTFVSIKNTGNGIEKDKLQYIWDRFYKTDSSRNSKISGFGLGLCIVKSIIDKHNQRITVDSVEGEYTRFTFSLESK